MRIFSKSFGGKIRHINRCYLQNKKKNWRMRIKGARIFLSFLAGNLKFLNSPQQESSQQKSRNKNFLVLNLGYLMRRV